MKNKKVLIIIFIAIVLFLSCGLIIFINRNNSYVSNNNHGDSTIDNNPKIDEVITTTIISDNGTTVIVTNSTSTTKENIDKKTSTTKKSSDKTSSTKKQSDKTSSTTKKATSKATSTTTSTTTTTTTQVVDENDLLRKEIENTYGITVKYGSEVNGYYPKGVSPNILTDKDEINDFLKTLKTEIGKYPTNFFREFGDMHLTLYLIKSMPNNEFNGLTDKEFASDVKITYVYGYEFGYTFHHELMHYIDYYLDIKYWNSNHYATFESFNPEGFTYGNINSSYSYYGQGASNNVYFFNDYAQQNIREDRAELFKFMMGRTRPYGDLLNSNYPTGKKARAIVNEILSEFPSFNTITPNWNKVLN